MDDESRDQYNSGDARIPSNPSNGEVKPKSRKKLMLFSVIAVISIFVLAFAVIRFYPSYSSNQPAHKYEITITHNGIPMNNVLGSSDLRFRYGIDIYNDSSVCYLNTFYPDNQATSLTDYKFTSDTKIGDKKLSDYAASGYAFDLFSYPSTSSASFEADLVAKHCCTFNSTKLYSELPKLTSDFSVNFDIPLLNESSFTVWKNESENKIHADIKMLDNWNENFTYVCQFRRAYDPQIDSNMTKCLFESVTQIINNQQCAKTTLNSLCGDKFSIAAQFIAYSVAATRNGNDISCEAPLSDLTTGKDYYMRLTFFKPSTDYYLRYEIEKR